MRPCEATVADGLTRKFANMINGIDLTAVRAGGL
jgi:hypothetical protein